MPLADLLRQSILAGWRVTKMLTTPRASLGIAQVAVHEFAQAETFVQLAHQDRTTIGGHPEDYGVIDAAGGTTEPQAGVSVQMFSQSGSELDDGPAGVWEALAPRRHESFDLDRSGLAAKNLPAYTETTTS